MEPVALVTIIALVEYFFFGLKVGQARGQFDVKPPAMTGHPTFERYVRVHYNTLEQIVIFLPALWLFAYYVRPGLAALIGLVFVVGRYMYFQGYVVDPSQRETGFVISMVAQALLVLGAFLGALVSWF